MPNQRIFVNLPVRDLTRAKVFWSGLGYVFDPRFTDENAACLVISDSIYVMLLTTEFFANFAPGKEIVDAGRAVEAIFALSAETRQEVDALVDGAIAAGATEPREPMDHGFLYQRSFDDLEGHQWEVVWMEPE